MQDFLKAADEATKAKYAAEMSNADGDEFKAPIDMWYAETLVHWGLLERHVEVIYTQSGAHVRGSRTKFRKAAGCSTTLSNATKGQSEMEFA